MLSRRIAVWKPRRRKFVLQNEHHALRRLIGHENYGINVFEGCRIYRLADGTRAIFRWEDHKRRLIESADAYSLPVAEWPFTPEQLWAASLKVAALNEQDSYLRPCVYIDGDLKVEDPDYTITGWAATRDWDPDVKPYLQSSGGVGLRLLLTDLKRSPPQAQTWAKGAGNYILSWKAKKLALSQGLQDGIVLDSTGQFISEGSGYAVLLYQAQTNTVIAPDANSSALESITVKTVKAICQRLGVRFERTQINHDAMFTMGQNGHEELVFSTSEMFVAGTAVEIKGVEHVQDMVSGTYRLFTPSPGPLTQQIIQLYRQIVTAEVVLDESWYTRLPS